MQRRETVDCERWLHAAMASWSIKVQPASSSRTITHVTPAQVARAYALTGGQRLAKHNPNSGA